MGFKDCKNAIDEIMVILKNDRIFKKKRDSKSNKKMSRTDQRCSVRASQRFFHALTLIEINSETDFVAKNKNFIDFCKELSEINLKVNEDLNKLKTQMKNNIDVDNKFTSLISKIGEKITYKKVLSFFDKNKGKVFFCSFCS